MIRTHPGQPPTRVFELDASLRGDALLAGLAALRPGHAAPGDDRPRAPSARVAGRRGARGVAFRGAR